MKTQTVQFSYGTVKNASLKIPAEAYSLMDVVNLIQDSFLEYMFRPGCGLMSDEVLVSSIGKSNFFAGALGGYKTRLQPDVFEALERCADNDIGLAFKVAKFRNPGISPKQAYLVASKNEALSEDVRRFLVLMAEQTA